MSQRSEESQSKSRAPSPWRSRRPRAGERTARRAVAAGACAGCRSSSATARSSSRGRPTAARPRAPRIDALADREHGRGRHQGLREAARDPGRRLSRDAQGHGIGARRRVFARGDDRPADRHHVRGSAADADHGQGIGQAGRRRDRRQDPQGPPAGAVQGQRHPLRGRARPQEGGEAGAASPSVRRAFAVTAASAAGQGHR